MVIERWLQIKSLFDAAHQKPAGELARFLDEECGSDQELRREVESLLACEDSAAGFLELEATITGSLAIAAEPVRVGERIGPYTILEPLGAGGMGQVYKAHDNRLGRQVAVKFLARAIAGDPATQQRFDREARAASALNHPNICTVHDVGEFEGHPFIVMELLEGQPLKERIAGKPLPFPEFASVSRQVSAGLGAAHAKGIVHRDVKPGNLFVTQSGQVKIFDFGLARQGAGTEGVALQPASRASNPSITTAGTITGTIAYMSPEQVLGDEVDARSDIFSLGVVLYEMATGRTPFRGTTVAGILGSILTEEPAKPSVLNPAVPARVDRLILKALEKDLGDRYPSVASLAADLEEWQRLDAAAARRHLLRKPHIAVATAIVLAVVLLALAVALWNHRSAASWDARFANARFSRITNFEGAEAEAALSADGKFVAFLSDRDGPVDVWISQVGSGHFTNLSKGRFAGLAFHWGLDLRPLGFAPDGTNVSLSWVGKSPDTWLLPVMGGISRPFLQPGFEAMWSADGSKLVYHSLIRGDPTFVADSNGSNPKQIFVDASGAHCHYPIWSPDGRFIYYTRGYPTANELDIWRIPSTGGDSERITHHNARIAYPTLLDNRTLVYSATSEDGPGAVLYAMDVEQRRPRVITTGVQEYSSVSASADGKRLVVTESKPSGSLWTVPLSDGVQGEVAARRFELPAGRAVSPRFGPDYLLYLSSTSGADGLWKFKDGLATELWKASGGGLIAPPAISPNGSRICIAIRRQGRTALYRMSDSGTDLARLAPNLHVRGSPSWSPDGNWIIVSGRDEKGSGLFKIPARGGSPVRFIDGFAFNPAWSPDGRLVLYSEPLAAGELRINAVTPDGTPVSLPDLRVGYKKGFYRFLPGGRALVISDGERLSAVDLTTGARHKLANLPPGAVSLSFDISRDGKQIIFDRIRDNSDVVLIELQ